MKEEEPKQNVLNQKMRGIYQKNNKSPSSNTSNSPNTTNQKTLIPTKKPSMPKNLNNKEVDEIKIESNNQNQQENDKIKENEEEMKDEKKESILEQNFVIPNPPNTPTQSSTSNRKRKRDKDSPKKKTTQESTKSNKYINKLLNERPFTRYSDLGGIEDILQDVREIIEYPIRHPEVFNYLGVQPARGVLLHGPPGIKKKINILHLFFLLKIFFFFNPKIKVVERLCWLMLLQANWE